MYDVCKLPWIPLLCRHRLEGRKRERRSILHSWSMLFCDISWIWKLELEHITVCISLEHWGDIIHRKRYNYGVNEIERLKCSTPSWKVEDVVTTIYKMISDIILTSQIAFKRDTHLQFSPWIIICHIYQFQERTVSNDFGIMHLLCVFTDTIYGERI